MKIKNFALIALSAAVLAAPAMANDNDHREGYAPQHREYSIHKKYEWSTQPGQTIMFKDPVSFEGNVTGINSSHTMIEADNGMTIEVPNQALVWNGDTQVFAQSNAIGSRVVVHLREDEPYKVMSQRGDELAIGSYDGVFWVSKAFIDDIDLDDLDGDIYRDTGNVDLNGDGRIQSDERDLRRYDDDLESSRDR